MDLTICTSTLYRGNDQTTELRKQLSLQLFHNAYNLAIPVVCIDKGSDESYLDMLRAMNVKIYSERALGVSGMGEARRAAFYIASGGTVSEYISRFSPNPRLDCKILWTEPEKFSLITEGNMVTIDTLLSEYNIVVPARSQDCIQGMPVVQRVFEMETNRNLLRNTLYSETFYDLMFGPKAFTVTGLKYFLDYGGILWDSIIIPVVNAIKAGEKVATCEVSFTYDEREVQNEQFGSREDFLLKRWLQTVSIMDTSGDRLYSYIQRELRNDPTIKTQVVENLGAYFDKLD